MLGGAPGWTRTNDLRLRSPVFSTIPNNLSHAYELAAARYRQYLVGAIAVICSRHQETLKVELPNQ